MGVISKPPILLQILYKDFLKGILHVVKKDKKITFLEQNEPKDAKIR